MTKDCKDLTLLYRKLQFVYCCKVSEVFRQLDQLDRIVAVEHLRASGFLVTFECSVFFRSRKCFSEAEAWVLLDSIFTGQHVVEVKVDEKPDEHVQDHEEPTKFNGDEVDVEEARYPWNCYTTRYLDQNAACWDDW